MARLARLFCLFAVSQALFGCAAVPPWDRGMLAKKKMTMDPDGQATALEQHFFEYREGASGGYGSVGGGCGCN